MSRIDDTSEALTEIRTVRSRAQSAVERIGYFDGLLERRRIEAAMDEEGYRPATVEHFRDQDADEMVALLQDFIDKTAKFAGRRTRRGI